MTVSMHCFSFKGTVCIILNDKIAISDSQQYLWNLYVNVKNIDIFLGLKVFNSEINIFFLQQKCASLLFWETATEYIC